MDNFISRSREAWEEQVIDTRLDRSLYIPTAQLGNYILMKTLKGETPMPNAADKEDMADDLLAALALIKHNLMERYKLDLSTATRATIIATIYDVDQALKLAGEKTE